jgi:hypothetical protein
VVLPQEALGFQHFEIPPAMRLVRVGANTEIFQRYEWDNLEWVSFAMEDD